MNEYFHNIEEADFLERVPWEKIIERSGYSRTTFYKYFRDIYDLENTLKEILLYHFDYFSEAYYAYLSAVDSGALEDVYQDIIMYYYKNPAHPSLADHLRYAQTIGHELMKIFQKIEKNEL